VIIILGFVIWRFNNSLPLVARPAPRAVSLLIANLVLWYSDETIYVAPEILSILVYPSFKQSLPLLKPFYVGTFWAGAISVVPHLIAHVDVIPDETIAMGLLTTSVSNMADIEDVDDDVKMVFTLSQLLLVWFLQKFYLRDFLLVPYIKVVLYHTLFLDVYIN